jgi:hypothetical protein
MKADIRDGLDISRRFESRHRSMWCMSCICLFSSLPFHSHWHKYSMTLPRSSSSIIDKLITDIDISFGQ